MNKYLGILETDPIKQEEMKEKKSKRGISGEQAPGNYEYSRKHTKWINIGNVILEKYSERFLKWTRELKQKDQGTRKEMAMH